MCAFHWTRPYPPRRSVIVRADKNDSPSSTGSRRIRARKHQQLSPTAHQHSPAASSAVYDHGGATDPGDYGWEASGKHSIQPSSPWLPSNQQSDSSLSPRDARSVSDLSLDYEPGGNFRNPHRNDTCNEGSDIERSLTYRRPSVEHSTTARSLLEIAVSVADDGAKLRNAVIPPPPPPKTTATSISTCGGVIQQLEDGLMYDSGQLFPKDSRQAESYYRFQTSGSRESHKYELHSSVHHVPSVMDEDHQRILLCQSLDVASSDAQHSMHEADSDGDLPLHIAVAKEDEEQVSQIIHSMMLSNLSLDVYNRLKQTPLHVAVMTAHTKILRHLLQAGSSCTVTDRNGNSAVHLAVRSSSMDCINILLENPMSITTFHQHNYDGYTPLHLAVFRQDTDLIGLLVSRGAECDVTDGTSGRTPLFHAVLNGHDNIVRKLISLGASVNMANYAGVTPLVMATDKRLKNITSLLISKGATVNAREDT